MCNIGKFKLATHYKFPVLLLNSSLIFYFYHSKKGILDSDVISKKCVVCYVNTRIASIVVIVDI